MRLSRGCRYAERTGDSFRNGLAFSSRPVRVQEVVRLRLGRSSPKWHGALRLGFTTVPPSARALPLPAMAIPDLTDAPGHWAAPVHESCCRPGAELRFWVCHSGSVHVRGGGGGGRLKLLTGVDLSRPLWAVVDIYGQTGSVYLLGGFTAISVLCLFCWLDAFFPACTDHGNLMFVRATALCMPLPFAAGSEKKWAFWTRRSCPAPDVDNCCSLIPDVPGLCGDGGKCISRLDLEVPAGQRKSPSSKMPSDFSVLHVY